ncbi:glyoxalase-like protein [Mycolicibacterium canariasense]|uniref:Glyoxalase-like protein n=1 Tax=Mycolicibacterium canariasense TaxID=228230 RepID=A0A100WHI3_MYCCR|nr:VOC family protein [Mycolicibacterium canariasense]MCV7211761.1 VOC family protein [Mycolicibacterium canariasense]ORV08169.1 glyoxalase [Mycolicibacterium canariasense]GAS98290.1 glyoxalase-like protein [Mycolicibacterium canariasense]
MPEIHLSFASVITDDIVGLSDFYRAVFDLPEVVELRSDHFRGLRIGATILGFSSTHAYELLNLDRPESTSGTTQFLTFELDSDKRVDVMTQAAVAEGARCIKDPARTYYGAWQSVLADPAGNVFRLNHLELA